MALHYDDVPINGMVRGPAPQFQLKDSLQTREKDTEACSLLSLPNSGFSVTRLLSVAFLIAFLGLLSL